MNVEEALRHTDRGSKIQQALRLAATLSPREMEILIQWAENPAEITPNFITYLLGEQVGPEDLAQKVEPRQARQALYDLRQKLSVPGREAVENLIRVARMGTRGKEFRAFRKCNECQLKLFLDLPPSHDWFTSEIPGERRVPRELACPGCRPDPRYEEGITTVRVEKNVTLQYAREGYLWKDVTDQLGGFLPPSP